MEKKKTQCMPMLLAFLLAFIPRAVLALIYGAPFSVPLDEMSTIASAAMSAGYDWSSVTTVANNYYGGGYTILFSPLFRMGMDPYWIYDIMLLVSCGLQAVGAPVCYYIMKKYLKITEKGILFWTSVAASYLVALRVMVIFNEHMLIAVSWLIALTICKLIEHNDDYKKKSIYTIILMLELSYILTCHTRVKTYWYALIVLVVLFYYLYKKWLVAVIPAVITGAVGYIVSGKFIDHIKTLVWHWQEGVKLKNSYVNLNISLSDFKEGATYKAILSTIFGQINSTFVLTAGVFCVLIVVIVCIWYGKLREVVLERYFHKEVLPSEITGEKVILMLSAFFGMCIVATTLAQSLTWLQKVLKAYSGGGTYGYKAFSYIRYNEIYYGPFFAAGMGYLYQCRERLKKYIKPSVLFFAFSAFVWLILNLPYIKNVAVAARAYMPFGYLWYYVSDNHYSAGMYLTAMIVVSISFIVFLILLWKKKLKISMLLFTLVLIYEYVMGGILIDAPKSENYVNRASATYEIFQQAEKYDEGDILPKQLYISINESGSMKRTYTYQFLLYEYQIIWELPPVEMAEAIVLANKNSGEELFEMGYLRCKLDNNEYLYIKGESLLTLFEELGCTFYDSIE